MPSSLPLVYHPDYDVPEWDEEHRFPMSKFRRLYKILSEEKNLGPVEFYQPEVATVDQLKAVHTSEYIQEFLENRLDKSAARRIGLPWTAGLARRTITAVGGTILTLRLALQHGLACNLGGGTHHAFPDFGSGFCIFNDASVAARMLLQEGLVQQILIVDLDVHQGDGTAFIHQDEVAVFTFSMHCQSNFPFRKQHSDLDVPLPENLDDDSYLRILRANLPELLERTEPDLVIYNAGVDPFKDDPLGKLNLTWEGLQARDQYVLECCLNVGVPVGCVIGGGYSKDHEELAWRHSLVHRAAAKIYQDRFSITPFRNSPAVA
ncbi:MAG: histone deacetylase [bacterium]